MKLFVVTISQFLLSKPFSDNQCWLYPDDKPEQQVQDHIRISDYLTIFGARSEFPTNEIPAPLDAKLHQLGKRWASNALELGPGLATLNYLATTCRKEQKLDVELTRKTTRLSRTRYADF